MQTRELIKQYVKQEGNLPAGVSLQVEVLRSPQNLQYKPDTKLRLRPIGRKRVWRGKTHFNLDIIEKGKRKGKPRLVEAELRWFAGRWVSRRELGYSDKIAAKDFEWKTVEIDRNQRHSITTNDPGKLEKILRNARLVRRMPVNAILTRAHFQQAPDVRPGTPLRVVIKGQNGLSISGQAEAAGNGRIGSHVNAKMRATGKMVSGVLIEKNVLEIEL